MEYCQAFRHPAKKATPTNDVGGQAAAPTDDVGLPVVVEQGYAEDNNEIVCTLKAVDNEGTLSAVVCPSCSHRNAPQVMSY
jgi:hypothetical protein